MITTNENVFIEGLTEKEIKRHERFINSVQNLTKHDYKLLTLYRGHKERIQVLHIECNRPFWVTPRHFYYYLQKNTFFCSRCTASNGEKVLHKALEEIGVPFNYETSWEGLIYKKKLRFDFTVYEDENQEIVKCHIEYDGAQHDKPVDYFGGEENFVAGKEKDTLKEEFCLQNKVPLIRIKSTYPLTSIEDLLTEILKKEIPEGIHIIK